MQNTNVVKIFRLMVCSFLIRAPFDKTRICRNVTIGSASNVTCGISLTHCDSSLQMVYYQVGRLFTRNHLS